MGHLNIPILADTTKDIAARYGVLIEDLGIALRGLFIINPEGVIEQITINNLPIGRNVDEALRLARGTFPLAPLLPVPYCLITVLAVRFTEELASLVSGASHSVRGGAWRSMSRWLDSWE